MGFIMVGFPSSDVDVYMLLHIVAAYISQKPSKQQVSKMNRSVPAVSNTHSYFSNESCVCDGLIFVGLVKCVVGDDVSCGV